MIDTMRLTSPGDFGRRKSTIGLTPVAMSTSHDPVFMRQASNLGAMNYLIKPISAETVHSLWLNVFSCRTHTHKAVTGNGFNSSITSQQIIFQRRIRAETVNGAFTADTRNATFEEDFIRQFVPAISHTLPGTDSVNSIMSQGHTPIDELDDGMDYFDDGFISSPRANALRSRLLEWAFCPDDLDREELLDCATVMIMDSAACVDLKLQLGRVRKFVKILESAYYDNPYHNFHHAIDVTQCTFYILHTLGMFNKTGPRRSSLRSPAETTFPLHTILRPTDVMALIIASLCHDLGHPGLNNAFMVRARTQLAELYNDQSVLENFHAACFSMVMSYYFTDFVLPRRDSMQQQNSHVTSFDYEEFRRIAVHAILATDMARHFEFIGKCKAQYERFVSGSNLPLTAQQHEAERAQLAASILKCADISNIVRPFNISQRWTQRLNNEITLQGNIEESLGLSRTIVVDTANVPASQIAFYETCGRPLFNAVADLVPELRYMPDQLENNIRNWNFIKNNQKVPEIPYGLKHSSTYDLSISTRAGSTDSAPDFLPTRSLAPLPFATSTTSTTVENSSLANYTLHAGGNLSAISVGNETDDDFAASRCLPQDSASAAARMFASTGVPSPPQTQHSATATSS
ncbi:3',5'-cyclic-nucleotide phosphodiesterase [Coemansia sp. RSA 353]|nr:3',5'-cyclic-nucleotide phosphodiesterase [Coemansia sp. RSA 1824]KAJ2254116.1 3',5'-cyclic-nucleotide phosphodiesterase [Coemansia sp. RSA 454]KAJ2292720.1 3',5'-cyclic-nucleotide phosphodiesterase [Coemansia sp. RSA 355]KAJ2296650.1 3',5'-cyclic-nucleotide phosphodiesterase [Coemansia sp. RSA 353]KAJ2533594.1 3',5'-cyclic-nucleotide phosphodiesterase [Coemansia sp. RSA 1935]KAJ2652885.1 3',5'-cyclic-nucleotide phosphodiesterase [Coemansia sp. RSA 1287]